MPGNFQYQVAIIGPGARRYGSILRRRLRERLRELDTELPDFFSFFSRENTDHLDPKSPIVGVYFGGRRTTVADQTALKHLARFKTVVLPVVSSTSGFTNQVPRRLHAINGTAIEPTDRRLETVTNLVLENFSLLRKTRRLFISYRRTDASTAALQIRHKQDEKGYDAFLDTHSVPTGDKFQEVLWQRLADSDVMLLLDSPGFLKSRWTREELAKASALTVGILQIIWPGRKPPRYSDLCERFYLKAADFKGLSLRRSSLKRIAIAVERLRARSLAARYDNLVREFCDAASTVNARAVVQPERYVLATLRSGRRIAAIPAVGIPDALGYHEVSLRFRNRGARVSKALLIYDHRGLRATWRAYLEWLNKFLPVQATRVTAIAKKLARL